MVRARSNRINWETSDNDNDDQKKKPCCNTFVIAPWILGVVVTCLIFIVVLIEVTSHQLIMLTEYQKQATSTHLRSLDSLEQTVQQMRSTNRLNREWLTKAKGIMHASHGASWTTDFKEHGEAVVQKIKITNEARAGESSSHIKYCGKKIQKHDNAQMMVLDSIDFPGGDLSTGPSAASTFSECCLECSNNKVCVGFTFVLSARQCWLKKDVIQRVSNTHTTSGILPFAEATIHRETEEFERLMRVHRDNIMQGGQENDNNSIMNIWPLPKHLAYQGPMRSVATNFRFKIALPTAAEDSLYSSIQNVAKRYEQRIVGKANDNRRSDQSSEETAAAITTINIICKNCDMNKNGENLLADAAATSTSSYVLDMPSSSSNSMDESSSGTLRTESFAGLIAGMETLTQICYGGMCNASEFQINDAGQYKYRGLMLDTGRRFIPIKLVRVIIDLMISLHFNVLHLHLTDWAAVRWSSNVAPELVHGATSQLHRQYSQQDIEELETFAHLRGVVLIPEMDVPGHASSFRPLESGDGDNDGDGDGVKFCSSKKQQLFNDPSHHTLRILERLASEMNHLFASSPIIHIGGDETEEQGSCKKKDISALTQSLQTHISKSLSKIPMVWNEVHTLNSVNKGTIVQCWNNCDVGDIASKGHRVVYSMMRDFYLDFVSGSCTLQGALRGRCLWIDIAKQMDDHPSQPNIKLLFGGSATMWTDEFCPKDRCVGHGEGWGGHAGWMYDISKDEEFGQALLKVIFPRLLLVGGSLWNYDKERSLESLIEDYSFSAERLERHARRIYKIEYPNVVWDEEMSSQITCPWMCKGGCTMTTRCGTLLKE